MTIFISINAASAVMTCSYYESDVEVTIIDFGNGNRIRTDKNGTAILYGGLK